VFEQALDGIVLFDEQMNVLDANPAACRSFDHDCERWSGVP
jgi:PAS domain-containing protein